MEYNKGRKHCRFRPLLCFYLNDEAPMKMIQHLTGRLFEASNRSKQESIHVGFYVIDQSVRLFLSLRYLYVMDIQLHIHFQFTTSIYR